MKGSLSHIAQAHFPNSAQRVVNVSPCFMSGAAMRTVSRGVDRCGKFFAAIGTFKNCFAIKNVLDVIGIVNLFFKPVIDRCEYRA